MNIAIGKAIAKDHGRLGHHGRQSAWITGYTSSRNDHYVLCLHVEHSLGRPQNSRRECAPLATATSGTIHDLFRRDGDYRQVPQGIDDMSTWYIPPGTGADGSSSVMFYRAFVWESYRGA
jgi:hypothetical protein